jgi:hypothetical protein
MAHRVLHRIGTTAIRALCCLALVVGFGCARHEPVPVVVPSSQPAAVPASVEPSIACPTDRESRYEQGVCAYEAGEIKRAVTLWREALKIETDPALRQKVLFALASVKLAQAGNETELNSALDLLETWAKGSPPGGSGEDPRMMLPAIRSLKPPFAVKELKATMERECSKKLAEREEQVRRSLQQQVKALETIHQQIQEKKKGLKNF